MKGQKCVWEHSYLIIPRHIIARTIIVVIVLTRTCGMFALC